VTELVLVRHAETVWNAEARWQGQTDVPLSPRGKGEVARVAERLRHERFDRVITSDLVRAADTARGIAPGARLETDVSLREMHLGAWCGLLHAEVATRFPDQLLALQRGDDTRIGGDGETVVELTARVTAAIDRIARESPGRVLIVTHGGVIRALLLDMLKLTGHTRPLVGAHNTAITHVELTAGRRVLRSYNDARHLSIDPIAHEERLVGVSAREAVASLLGVSDDVLGVPHERSESRVVTQHKQLVTYALGDAGGAPLSGV